MRFAKKHFEYFEHTYEQRHLYIHVEEKKIDRDRAQTIIQVVDI